MPEPNSAEFLHAIVYGRVQGVGFREFVLRHSQSLGLAGYVRNLPDGRSVEVVAEGARQSLDRLLAHLSEGPRSSAVQSIESHWSAPMGGYRDFSVRY